MPGAPTVMKTGGLLLSCLVVGSVCHGQEWSLTPFTANPWPEVGGWV